MELPSDWRDLLSLFSGHGVRFIVVGAHAVAAAGRPRATQDLDLWVEPTSENASRIGRALGEFGFPGIAEASEGFAQPDRMARLGNPPLRIDLMTSIDGVEFDEAWEGRVVASWGGVEVGFLSREHLLRNKRATGRAKDRLDVELLLEGDG